MEVTGLVPNAVEYAGSGTPPTPSQPIPDHTDLQTGHSATNSRVGYLRDRFRGLNLSKTPLCPLATEDIQLYDSLFGKWVRWCNQRDTNPFSVGINEVVNFLAELFQQGYQYRSLNAYRSAISSVMKGWMAMKWANTHS
jgi:hypothetical protein